MPKQGTGSGKKGSTAAGSGAARAGAHLALDFSDHAFALWARDTCFAR